MNSKILTSWFYSTSNRTLVIASIQPLGAITLYQHGATSGDRAPRRSVVIEWPKSAPVVPEPVAPEPTVPDPVVQDPEPAVAGTSQASPACAVKSFTQTVGNWIKDWPVSSGGPYQLQLPVEFELELKPGSTRADCQIGQDMAGTSEFQEQVGTSFMDASQNQKLSRMDSRWANCQSTVVGRSQRQRGKRRLE